MVRGLKIAIVPNFVPSPFESFLGGTQQMVGCNAQNQGMLVENQRMAAVFWRAMEVVRIASSARPSIAPNRVPTQGQNIVRPGLRSRRVWPVSWCDCTAPAYAC